MSYQTEWVVDKVVLQIRYTGDIKNDDLPEINERLLKYLDEGESPIHVISNLHDMKELQIDLKSSRKLLPIMSDERWGWIVIVGANPITQFLSQLMTHLLGKKTHSFKTLDEAKSALGIEDSRLTDIFIQSAQKDRGA